VGRKGRILIWMTVTVALNAVFDVAVGLPYDDLGFAIFATTGLSALFAFAWVRVDSQERDVKLGAWGPAVALITKIALPAYFVLSRGWSRGLLATSWALAIVCAMLGLYLATVETTVWVIARAGW
jgi:hypothetical protein